MRAMRCPRLTSHPIPWPVPFSSPPLPPRSGRSVGGPHVVCRPSLSCRAESHRPFSLACSTALSSPLSALSVLQTEEEAKRIPNPRSHHPHPAQSIPQPTKGFEGKHTSFSDTPREPPLSHPQQSDRSPLSLRLGGLGEQNVSLSHPLNSTQLTAFLITVRLPPTGFQVQVW